MTEQEIAKLVEQAYDNMVASLNLESLPLRERTDAFLAALNDYADKDGFFSFDKFTDKVLADNQINMADVATYDADAVALAVNEKIRGKMPAETAPVQKAPQVRVGPSLRERLAAERMGPADKFFHALADRLENEILDALRHPEKIQAEKTKWSTRYSYMINEGYSYQYHARENRFLSFTDPSLASLTCQDAWETGGFKRLAALCAGSRLNMGLGEKIRPNKDNWDDCSKPEDIDLSKKFGAELRIYLDDPYMSSKHSVSPYKTGNCAPASYGQGGRWDAKQTRCGIKEELAAEKREEVSQYLSALADTLEEKILAAVETPKAIREMGGKRVFVLEDKCLNYYADSESLATAGGKKLDDLCVELDMKLEVKQTNGAGGQVRVFIDAAYPAEQKEKRAQAEAKRAQEAGKKEKALKIKLVQEVKDNGPGLAKRMFSAKARKRRAADIAAIEAGAAPALVAAKALTL